MARIFIFGDSHTRALKDALNNYDLPDSSLRFDIHWKLKEKNGTVFGDLRYEDALTIASELTEGDLLVISLLGTSHNEFGLIKHEIPFYLSGAVRNKLAGAEGCLIPVNLMRDMFADLCRKNKLIPQLKKTTRAK